MRLVTKWTMIMRYSEIDLQCEDITWFGIDANNHIVAFASGGIGNVPEYVCRSKKETEVLYDYFYDTLSKTTVGHALISNNNALVGEFVELSAKGLFCFDVDAQDAEGEFYKKISCPDTPILFDDLPANVKAILQDHLLNADLSECDQFKVPHAY